MGGAGNALQGLLVQLDAHRPAFKPDGFPFHRADAHGVDPHTPVCRRLGRVQRIDAGGALAVRQQDDGSRVVGAGRDRRERFPGAGIVFSRLVKRQAALAIPAGFQRFQVNARVGKQLAQRHDDAVADGRSALQLELVNRRREVFAAQRGWLHHGGGAGKGHHADPHAARQVGQEGLGGVL